MLESRVRDAESPSNRRCPGMDLGEGQAGFLSPLHYF